MVPSCSYSNGDQCLLRKNPKSCRHNQGAVPLLIISHLVYEGTNDPDILRGRQPVKRSKSIEPTWALETHRRCVTSRAHIYIHFGSFLVIRITIRIDLNWQTFTTASRGRTLNAPGTGPLHRQPVGACSERKPSDSCWPPDNQW